jgi:hypothetical protein
MSNKRKVPPQNTRDRFDRRPPAPPSPYRPQPTPRCLQAKTAVAGQPLHSHVAHTPAASSTASYQCAPNAANERALKAAQAGHRRAGNVACDSSEPPKRAAISQQARPIGHSPALHGRRTQTGAVQPKLSRLPAVRRPAVVQRSVEVHQSGGTGNNNNNNNNNNGNGKGGGKEDPSKGGGSGQPWGECCVCSDDQPFRLGCGHYICSDCFFHIVATSQQQQVYDYGNLGGLQLLAPFHTHRVCPLCRAPFTAQDANVAHVSRASRNGLLQQLLAQLQGQQ